VTRSTQGSRRRILALVPAAALVVTGLAAGATTGSATAAPASPGARSATGAIDASYINYVAPEVEHPTKDGKVSKQTLDEARKLDAKFNSGNPVAAMQLAKAERKAIRTGTNPINFKGSKGQQTAQLLTILVEFNDSANDDFSGVQVPKTVFGARTCAPEPEGTIKNGPLHNNIPNPANFKDTLGEEDNNSFWVPDFSEQHFDKMLYTKEGITDRVRPDLTGPDGQPGIDISGYTMRNMYEEMSKGRYTVTGQASPWITVPHSEAWYGADRCTFNGTAWVPGNIQDMNGHPDNPLGAGQLAKDAVDTLAAARPDFPWADYDVEDQGDIDGDGNRLEPDGIVDHLVLVHAGEDKSGGGGAQGTYAIWAHSSAIAKGYKVPGQDVAVSNYIVQPEDSGVGVFAHEYGHDLGLPDLYDTASGGESDVNFWDLMSSGSHSGPIFQSMPAHMGIWDKWVLGWADPQVFDQGADPQTIKLGQTSRTPLGSKDGAILRLPDKTVQVGEPHGGSHMWWSDNDQDWADNNITRDISVPTPAGADTVRFWMWNDYVLEEDWDFGFVEVSTDGGATWEEQVVRTEVGDEEVSTPADYPDPFGRMADYGGKKFGLTGSSDGWRHDYVDLTPFAGQDIKLRLRYATDAAFQERGWFADDFSLTDGASTVWSDDVESGDNGWTAHKGTFVLTSPPAGGWSIVDGSVQRSQFYLAEWRNFDGFDEGLKYTYDTTYSNFGPWKVEKVQYNAPGMLVWIRDAEYGDANHVRLNLFNSPSFGAKGGLLLVDSHFDPLRRTGDAAVKDPSSTDNLQSRPQSSNVAFGLQPTSGFKECLAEVPQENWFTEYCTTFGAQPPVATFTDAKGWVPGAECVSTTATCSPTAALRSRYTDGSVVVPQRPGADDYTVRVVHTDGTPAPEAYSRSFQGFSTGVGNPTDPWGIELSVLKAGPGNTYALVRVNPAD
jgi:immune inhibitor A